MGYKWIQDMDFYEIIRRWHAGQPITHIATNLGYDRKTVRKYIRSAQELGLTQDQPLPDRDLLLETIQAASLSQTPSRPARAQQILEPYLDEVAELVQHNHNPLKPKTAFEVICERHDLESQISYSSFKRFMRSHEIAISPDRSTCRIEVPPGMELQVDYGDMGLVFDPLAGRRRKVYAFIGTLSHSRHQYVEYVFSQNKESFVASHIRMFEYFGGVPVRILLDNLKSGVIKPDLYDPVLNRSYRDMAHHYDCFLDPCKVRTPKHKGKVESQVKTVREQFRKILTLTPKADLYELNQQIKSWCLGKYGHRNHGTTSWQPYPTFLKVEQPALKPLPEEPFEVATWKECTVHADHYIQFKKKAYSVPTKYIGQKLWVKGTDRLLQVYYESRLVKQHIITPHYRHTDWIDFPESVQKVLDEGLPDYLQRQAGKVGTRFRELMRRILEPHAYINLKKAQSLVGLMDHKDHPLLEKAAGLTLDQHLSLDRRAFIQLVEKLEAAEQPDIAIPMSLLTQEFIRPMDYFVQDQ